VKTQGKIIDTGRKKLGAILGDNVKTGINVSLMPGVLVSPNSKIFSGSVLFKNFE